MSVEQYVAIPRSRLPSVLHWQEAVRLRGFDITIDDADLTRMSGFLPVQFMGSPCGFEFYLEKLADVGEREIDFGDRDAVVTFRTGSDKAEAQCALVCAAVLVDLAGGVYFDDYDGQAWEGETLIKQARDWMDEN